MIQVTKPFLPPREEYERLLEGIWQRNILTNNGPLVVELEQKLKEYLGVPYLLYVTNGTIALQLAIKALGLKGEIITTPFSYVATTSSIVWEGCQPVFVDIDERTLNINPALIEQAITEKTSAILATHVYGNPCDIDTIEQVARKHNLKVIYDAAHCFGTSYKGESVFAYGDISTTSFHATKLFHTVEGGAVFSRDEKLIKKLDFMRNFGHNGPEDFAEVGINGKNSEFHAAMGLVNLNFMPFVLKKRKLQWVMYDNLLNHVKVQALSINKLAIFNYAYYPLILESEEVTLRILNRLQANQIFPRRYFYPALNTVRLYASGTLPVSESVSRRILCLPIFHELADADIERICKMICNAI
ncbi:MAG: DegT/DnrJ/EryC1/StrS family aminotransferase [Flammeovirgaceae bacterium]|nr:MAG: DegT/DnrJ/EryC1/StrS family aminotransferase [Flammeovirgaceae bacterium]